MRALELKRKLRRKLKRKLKRELKWELKREQASKQASTKRAFSRSHALEGLVVLLLKRLKCLVSMKNHLNSHLKLLTGAAASRFHFHNFGREKLI